MIVYHGSIEIIKNPDVVHSKKFVFKTVDMYFRGLWDKKKVLSELRYYKMNNQICIVNQETLNRLLTYQNSYEVKCDGR